MGTITSQQCGNESAADNQLIWLDSNIDIDQRERCYTITQLEHVFKMIGTFTDGEECVNFIKTINYGNVFVIMSGALGEQFVSKIHDMLQVKAILIFCGNRRKHELWARNWSKIKGVSTDINTICTFLTKVRRQFDENATITRFMPPNAETNGKNLDQLQCSFMYTQILKEILLTMAFEPEYFQKFIQYCKDIFVDGTKNSEIEDLKQNYANKSPIWCYTRYEFLYGMVNTSLRTMNVKTIMKIGFFINDVHHQIEKLHSEQFSNHPSERHLTLYRGQGYAKTELDRLKATKGGLISFNNFLSTSRNRHVSLMFARGTSEDPDKSAVLFVMTIDPSRTKVPFAYIADESNHKDEEEVLFSMHTIFRIGDIKPFDEDDRIIQIELTLTSDDDRDVRRLNEYIRENIQGSTGWHRLRVLLSKLGQTKEAEEVQQIIFDQTEHTTKTKHPYWKSLSMSENPTKPKSNRLTCQRSLSVSHYELIASYNHRGDTYCTIGDYSKALSAFEEMIRIQEDSIPPNHPDFALSYNKIGFVYFRLGQYETAIQNYNEAIRIQQKSLPSSHPDLGLTYNNIGEVYKALKDYSKASSYFKRAVIAGIDTLPSNDPNLMKWQQNLEYAQKH